MRIKDFMHIYQRLHCHSFDIAGKVFANFCAKYWHQQVIKHEAYLASDIGTIVWKAFSGYLLDVVHLLLHVSEFTHTYLTGIAAKITMESPECTMTKS